MRGLGITLHWHLLYRGNAVSLMNELANLAGKSKEMFTGDISFKFCNPFGTILEDVDIEQHRDKREEDHREAMLFELKNSASIFSVREDDEEWKEVLSEEEYKKCLGEWSEKLPLYAITISFRPSDDGCEWVTLVFLSQDESLWLGWGFCKTQYAEKGIWTHIVVCRLLHLMSQSVVAYVSDEADYYHNVYEKDVPEEEAVPALSKMFGESEAFIRGFAEMRKKGGVAALIGEERAKELGIDGSEEIKIVSSLDELDKKRDN